MEAQGDLLHLAIVFVRFVSMGEILLFLLLVMSYDIGLNDITRSQSVMLPCYVRIIFSNFVWIWFASHLY